MSPNPVEASDTLALQFQVRLYGEDGEQIATKANEYTVIKKEGSDAITIQYKDSLTNTVFLNCSASVRAETVFTVSHPEAEKAVDVTVIYQPE